MGTASNTLYYLVHPSELRAILQWKIWHQPVHERDEETEAITLRRCFDFLDKTSRSFAAVIKELHPELLVPICIFYLILRGMDTIEDDMTIAIDEKEPILRSFDKVLEMDGWTYEGNHSKEKDRDLLVQFHYVITEFKKIKPEFREVISDITNRMGNGMADYCVNAEQLERGVETIKEYELYCHHVAGLVGEGLTRLFIICGRANPALIDRSDLTESMGQFLQQTNIIRDIKEDNDEKRRFWPKEVWSKYVDNFGDLLKPEYREKALQCSSEMVLLALERAPDCLFYLAGMKDQSVFNFTAIPQIMAIATLELVYRNPDIFERNVKITKGQACGYMIESSQNLQILYKAFVTVARRIHKKSDPRDPNFLKISIACGRIEQFVESVFASQGPNVIVGTKSNSNQTGAALTDDELNRQKKADAEAKKDTIYLVLAMLTVLLFVVGTMIIVAQYFGARFDLIYKQLFGTLTPEEQLIIDTRFPPKKSHNEL